MSFFFSLLIYPDGSALLCVREQNDAADGRNNRRLGSTVSVDPHSPSVCEPSRILVPLAPHVAFASVDCS